MSKNICADNPISFLANLKTGAQRISFISVEVERIYIFLTYFLAFCCGEKQEFPLLSKEATSTCGNKNNLTFFFYGTRVEKGQISATLT